VFDTFRVWFTYGSVNGTGFVAEEPTEKVDRQEGSAVRHLPRNNGDRGLRRLQVNESCRRYCNRVIYFGRYNVQVTRRGQRADKTLLRVLLERCRSQV